MALRHNTVDVVWANCFEINWSLKMCMVRKIIGLFFFKYKFIWLYRLPHQVKNIFSRIYANRSTFNCDEINVKNDQKKYSMEKIYIIKKF